MTPIDRAYNRSHNEYKDQELRSYNSLVSPPQQF